jgi:hypothetical protein
MSETSIRWAAASAQFAANRQQQAAAKAPRPITDQQSAALRAMSPEQAFALAYSLGPDDDLPNVPEPHPRSIVSRQERADAARPGAAPGWREQLDAARLDAFRLPPSAAPEQPWDLAVRVGQQSGVLPAGAPPAVTAQPPTPAAPEAASAAAADAPGAPEQPASPPQAAPGGVEQPPGLPELFGAMQQQLSLPIAPPAPSDDAMLRRAWRSLPDGEREAVARWVEASDYQPGYLAALDSPDWRSVLVGDSLVNRLGDARRLQPDLTPEAFMAEVLRAAQGQG